MTMTWKRYRTMLFSWQSLLDLIVQISVYVICLRRGFGVFVSVLLMLIATTAFDITWEVVKFCRSRRAAR